MKKNLQVIMMAVLLVFVASASFAEDPIVLKIGMTTEIGGHYHSGAVHFKEQVEKYTDGRVRVDIFPSSQLGNERDMVEGVGMGFLEMCIVSTGPLPNFSPDFMIFDLPYIFKNRDEAFKAMDGEIGAEILKSLEPKGIKALGFWENGFRHISNNKKALFTPGDVKGMKIRTMENPIHQATFKTLGATPTPMAWGEVFVALQQGVIDGQENPLVIVYTTKLYEIQKHISLTGHFYSPAVFMISKQIFDGFPKDIQDAIVKAEKEARDYERQFSAQLDEQLVESLKKEGVTFVDVDKDEWKNACAPVYDQFKSQINPKYLEALLGN